jgi:diguanylate cyclase (GGDEF)-like protein/PAS domain S-box-containing protein
MDDNFPPYIFRDNEGNLQGILKDTWDLWASKTGAKVRLEATDWAKAQRIMQAGDADVIDTMFQTDARSLLYDFSKPGATLEVAIFFHKSIGGIASVQNLLGFTVGVKEGDVTIDWLKQHGIKSFKPYPSYEALIAAAEKNEIKVFCMDKPPALYFLNKRNLANEFRYSAPLYSGQFHWATHKGKLALHDFIEQGFDRISIEEHAQIEQKWLGSPLHRQLDFKFGKAIAYWLLGAAALAVFMLVWNSALRRRVHAKTAELRSTLESLRASQQHFEALVTSSPVGVFEALTDGSLVYVNDKWLEITGMSQRQALAYGWADALYPDDRELVMKAWRNAVQEGQVFKLEYRLARPDQKKTWVLGQISFIKDVSGSAAGHIGSITDITERKAAETQIEYMAYHDQLTALPNRFLFKEQMQTAMAHAHRTDTKVALLFMDLDNFKTVNDTLGHPIGDKLIKAVAARLKTSVRDSDTVCRHGGDEFLILLADISDAMSVTKVTEKILERLADAFEIEGQELSTSISMGIAIYPDDGNEFDTLLKKADTAMYDAKEAGRNTYRFYTDQMNANAVETLQMRNSLRNALLRNEFVLYYQPQINLGDDQLIGAEALIRWNHPELGLVPPARFIPIAEDSGLIVQIGDWVLREACRQAAEWRQAGLPPLLIAVNLSAVQFKRGDLVKSVSRALDESGLDPALLELELTESILIQDTDNVLATIRRLKALGIKLSIDDFGTGYSSLAYLRRFNLDKLKIDQSFVRDIDSDPDDAAIVRAIIQMAHSLKLQTIAEGVENAQVLSHLRALECDQAQGYYFSRPMPATAFIAFFTEKQASPASS